MLSEVIRSATVFVFTSILFFSRLRFFVVVVFILSCGAFMDARAQQTIFNVPSSDVLPKGRVYGELDVTWKPNDSNDNAVRRFSTFVPRIVAGVGGNVEIGLNVNGNIQPGPDATTLIPAIKWRVYNGKDNGWSVVVGDHLYLPVRNKAYDAGNYVYAQVSRAFNGGRTRVTAGGYDFSHNVVASGAHRAGGQFGFEHAVNSKFTVQADWFTGKHASGYFTPGFYIKPHPKVTLYGGYSIGNADFSKGNHFFYTAIGINFN
ncbi:MAG: hypothetical protein WBV94_24600 [Blastocatellia bacterium]